MKLRTFADYIVFKNEKKTVFRRKEIRFREII
jgi:hypothetical protein